MTPWEFNCCVEGWQDANAPSDEKSDLPMWDHDSFRAFMDS